VDHHTTVDHAQPHATGRELYKGILDGKASAVFNGKVLVRKDAQKTNSGKPIRTCCFPMMRGSTANRNSKYLPTTCAAPTAPPSASWMPNRFSICNRAALAGNSTPSVDRAFAQDIVDRIRIPAVKDSLEAVLLEKFREHSH